MYKLLGHEVLTLYCANCGVMHNEIACDTYSDTTDTHITIYIFKCPSCNKISTNRHVAYPALTCSHRYGTHTIRWRCNGEDHQLHSRENC